MYKVVDKETFNYEDGDKLVKYRGKSTTGESDIYCVEIVGDNGKLLFHWRYKTEKEANDKYNRMKE